MLRAIVVVGFLLGLISLVVFGSGWLQTSDNDSAMKNQPVCDLLAGPCKWETATGHWQVDLRVMGDPEQGVEYQLTVHSPTPPARFLAVLRGESMYMGEYPVPLRKEEDGEYSAHFAAPLCTTGAEMVWRVDLQEGQQPLSGSETVPLKLVFQAQDH